MAYIIEFYTRWSSNHGLLEKHYFFLYNMSKFLHYLWSLENYIAFANLCFRYLPLMLMVSCNTVYAYSNIGISHKMTIQNTGLS